MFSLASALWIAWFGAAAFGAGAAYALSAGMGAIQSRLDGRQRVLAFAAFHVVLRVGLGISAIGAGVAGDLLADVRWPLVGTLGAVTCGAAVCGRARGAQLVAGPPADTVDVPPDIGTKRETPSMTVAIVTDSAAAIPPSSSARHQISVVPMWIHLGDDDDCRG